MPARPRSSIGARRRARGLAAVAAAALVVVAAAGCTNSESAVQKNPHTGTETATPSASGVQQIVLKAGPDLRFHPSTIVVHPGRVHIVLRNTAPVGQGAPHNLSSSRVPSLDIGLVTAGRQGSVTFTAPAPGRYRFVCTIHEAEGQVGTLVVEPAGSK